MFENSRIQAPAFLFVFLILCDYDVNNVSFILKLCLYNMFS